ncbi:MAG TPA: hypothetical protein VI756_28330, partial [Blastocatellia bacterium]
MKHTGNPFVRNAVAAAIGRLDEFISGARVNLPRPKYRHAIDHLIERRSSSVTASVLFFLFYWLQDPSWDLKSLPVGIRGRFGDRYLSEELNRRGITLHNGITAFAENLGWKGDVVNVDLRQDSHFNELFTQIADAAPEQRTRIADYLAERFAASRRVIGPLPSVGDEVLTFVRAKQLFWNLLELKSEGHVPQFAVAALLLQFRQRQGLRVQTHQPHAADKYLKTAGDIEELDVEGNLVRAYEVTMASNWRSRIPVVRAKMDKYHLGKYIVIAAGVNADKIWAVPAKMALTIERSGRDIAVIDIHDVVNFLAAELSPTELKAAVNNAYDWLVNPKLS